MKPYQQANHCRYANQQGAALIMTLIFLVLLTMIGVTSVRVSTMEERMAGNTSDRYRAFQAAEAALRDCEGVLSQSALPATAGLYSATVTWARDADSSNWSSSTASRQYSGTVAGVASQPRCIIELLAINTGTGQSLQIGKALDETRTYRITARGTGISGSTVVMLQSYFVR